MSVQCTSRLDPEAVGCEQAWARAHPASHRQLMVVVASGLVLGEGTASIVSALLRALVLPHSS